MEKFSNSYVHRTDTTKMSTIYTGQMPTFHVFRKVHSVLESELSTVYRVVSQVLGMKRRHLK